MFLEGSTESEPNPAIQVMHHGKEYHFNLIANAIPHGGVTVSSDADRLMKAVILALVKAFQDPRRLDLLERGLDERDLAYEATLLDPPDVETTRYVGHRRRGILRTYRYMESVGLLDLVDRKGVYGVSPTDIALAYYEYFTLPFWRRWLLRITGAAPPKLSCLVKKLP